MAITLVDDLDSEDRWMQRDADDWLTNTSGQDIDSQNVHNTVVLAIHIDKK